MNMVRMIYVSRPSPKIGLNELQAILESARTNNQKLGVTGILCYDPEYFLQWLEGPREGVNEIYRRISRDGRHSGLTLIDFREISARRFGNWSMAYLMADEIDPGIFFRFSPATTSG